MRPPLAVYAAALRRAADGARAPFDLVDPAGRPICRLDAATWCHGLRPGDRTLLSRCTGATLDVGCGPGRLAAALAARGLPALGVDVSAEAVRQARRRGARAVRRCVFGPVPAAGRWRHALLADGNIGIGGDPVRLLRRCRQLVGGTGALLVEVEPPGVPAWCGAVALADGVEVSAPFRWAFVGADDLAVLAAEAALRVVERWTEAGRWFATLHAA